MDLDRKFEKFKGGPTAPNNEKLHVTLGKSGIFFFNKNAYRMWGKPLGVHIFYNREDDQIAFVPTMPRGAEAFPIKEKSNGWVVHANPFCRHFGIRPDATVKFIDPNILPDGKLILDLSRTIGVGLVKPRTRKSKVKT